VLISQSGNTCCRSTFCQIDYEPLPTSTLRFTKPCLCLQSANPNLIPRNYPLHPCDNLRTFPCRRLNDSFTTKESPTSLVHSSANNSNEILAFSASLIPSIPSLAIHRSHRPTSLAADCRFESLDDYIPAIPLSNHH
jgi:hypothetical protein